MNTKIQVTDRVQNIYTGRIGTVTKIAPATDTQPELLEVKMNDGGELLSGTVEAFEFLSRELPVPPATLDTSDMVHIRAAIALQIESIQGRLARHLTDDDQREWDANKLEALTILQAKLRANTNTDFVAKPF